MGEHLSDVWYERGLQTDNRFALMEEIIRLQQELIQKNFQLIAAREVILEYKRKEAGL